MTQLPVEGPRPFGKGISVLMLLSSRPSRQHIQAALFFLMVKCSHNGARDNCQALGARVPEFESRPCPLLAERTWTKLNPL